MSRDLDVIRECARARHAQPLSWFVAIGLTAVVAVAGCGNGSSSSSEAGPTAAAPEVAAPAVPEVVATADTAEPTPTATQPPDPTPTPTDLDVPVVPPVIGLDPWRAARALEEVGLLVPVARQRWSDFDTPVVVGVDPPEGMPVEPGGEARLGVGEASDLLPGEVVEATVVRDWVVPPLDEQARTIIDVELVGGRTVAYLERRIPVRTQVVDIDAEPPLGCDRRPLGEGERIDAGSMVRFRFVTPPGMRSGVDEHINVVGISLVC